MIPIFSRSIVLNTDWTNARLFKMVGKPGLSSISLLLIRVAVGIPRPFPIVRCAPPRPL
jgi:hypothetical protein